MDQEDYSRTNLFNVFGIYPTSIQQYKCNYKIYTPHIQSNEVNFMSSMRTQGITTHRLQDIQGQ